MIKREITDEEELKKLEDAIAFRNVSNMPARVKCALLAWHTLEDILNKKDILFILGKGHEKYMIIKDKKIPFNEKKTVLEYIKR